MEPFVHLHLHTEYSLLDGAAKIENLFAACKENNMPAVAITDHGAMYGVIEFYNAAVKAGIKPIIGCEFYVAKDHRDRQDKDMEHLVLLAKDWEGYKNIVKLNSIAFVDGFYYKPRIDFELLEKHSKGLVCLSACLAGGVPRLLIKGEYEKAKQTALKYKSIFEDGDYYIELQDHGIKEQKYINPMLCKIADEIGVKTVATNDVHYINKKDAEMHDVLLCVQTGKTLDDPQRMKFQTDEFYLKNYQQMKELFPDREEALATTLEIAEKCNVKIRFKMALIPNYVPEDNKTPKQFIRELVEKGLPRRYAEITPQIRERVETELAIIDRMGFNEYYLIVWDFINYAKKNGIPVGPGRGSGVGSIAAYAMGITNVDPLRYNLLFERFLNPERMSMPDFDIDFCFERRGEVIDYVIQKYGADKVAQIVTFGTMAARAAIKDVARVYNMPYAEVDKITKLIPFGKTELKNVFGIAKDSQPIPELMQLYAEDANIKRVVDMAVQIEGMPRNTSTHAAGVVICKETISDYIPLQRNGDDITTQFTMKEVEELGMLKMDFLGLRTLTDIKKTIDYIKEQRGIDIDFDKLSYDDKGVYELISEGDTDAVFQLESGGMKRFMRELKPDNLEDIIAGISLYRPGPMDSIPKYISGKSNFESVTYAHPLLKPILEVTYGCIVYQEQVMQIFQKLGGFSLGQADIIRRAMGKKEFEKMKKQKNAFIYGSAEDNVDGAIKRGVPEKIAIELFDEMEGFAKYAFNKSHAAAYAVLAYQTAYLKRYFREEFITAVLNNRITSIDEIKKYIAYARKCGINVLPPDINKSGAHFSVENKSIRFGLAAIKNCGENAVSAIIKERNSGGEFKGLSDFLNRVDLSYINKRMIESFIFGGAFDCFGVTRSALMQVYEAVLNRIAKDKKKKEQGQFSLFEMMGEEEAETENYPDVEEFPLKQKLFNEREVLGVYVSGHPLDQYRHIFEEVNFDSSMLAEAQEEEELERDYLNDKSVIMAGMLSEVRKILTKSGKEMATARLEDLYGSVEIVLFNNSYYQNRQYLIDDAIVYVYGKVNIRENFGAKIIAEKLLPCAETKAGPRKKGRLYLKIKGKDLDDIYEILRSYEGECRVIAKIGEEAMEFPFKVDYCNALKSELMAFVEEKDIVFKE
jgi:DNA polymerase-3 subunit alpha